MSRFFRRRCATAVGLALALTGRVALGANLVVAVEGLAGDGGSVRVAVCTAETFLQPTCAHVGRTAAAGRDRVEVEVAGIPPGVYAVQAFHDENDNATIDRTMLGRPTEGMGFSNDAAMRFGPPRFEAAAIRIDDGSHRISIRLRYFDR